MTKRIGDKDEAQQTGKKTPTATPDKKTVNPGDGDKAKTKDAQKKTGTK